MPQSQRHNRKRRRRRSGKRSRTSTFLGNVLLEIIAVAALLTMLSISKFGERQEPLANEVVANKSSEFGSLITGFVADQVDRHQFFSRN